MRGQGILKGDVGVFEHGIRPKAGDVVAALMDGESLVRVYSIQQGWPVLEAAHPAVHCCLPVHELVIQGVMVGLVRHSKVT